MMIGEIEWI